MATMTEFTTGEQSSNVQMAVAVLFGAVLAVVGVVAPIVAGEAGEFIVFGRNYLHDAVHLLSGLAGLLAGYASGGRYAGLYNRMLGVVYLLVTVLGFVFFELFADLIALNTADNVLHLGLAVAFLAVGFGLRTGAE